MYSWRVWYSIDREYQSLVIREMSVTDLWRTVLIITWPCVVVSDFPVWIHAFMKALYQTIAQWRSLRWSGFHGWLPGQRGGGDVGSSILFFRTVSYFLLPQEVLALGHDVGRIDQPGIKHEWPFMKFIVRTEKYRFRVLWRIE